MYTSQPAQDTATLGSRIPGNGGLKQTIVEQISPIAENFSVKEGLLDSQSKLISMLRSKLQPVILDAPSNDAQRGETPDPPSSQIEAAQRSVIRQLQQNNAALAQLLDSIRL